VTGGAATATAAEALRAVREADTALAALGPAPLPLPLGELAPVVAGTVSALDRADWWLPSLRERAGAVVRGVPVERLIDGLAGARPYRVVPAGGSPALRALVAVGLALGERARAAGGERGQQFVAVHLGIGSASDGALYEALNLAALFKPDVAFVVSVHPLTGDAPLGRQLAASPAALARAFGIDAVEVDGSDAAAVSAAVAAARSAGGPHVVVAALPQPQAEAAGSQG
jgi:TPP-dependent pyruvate/acetoin dehydrogenase alpha subunit